MGINEDYKKLSVFPIGEKNEAFADKFIGESFFSEFSC